MAFKKALSFTHTIAFRFLIYLLVFSICLTAMSTIWEIYNDYTESLDSIEDTLSSIPGQHLGSLGRALWFFDDEQTQNNINAILSLPNVDFLDIQTSYGETIAGTKPESSFINKTFDLFFYRTADDPEPKSLGTVQVYASYADVIARIKARITIVSLIEAAKVFLVAAFVIFAFQIMVTRHLEKMAHYARNFSLKNLSNALKLTRSKWFESNNDEINLVAASINNMRLSIQEQLTGRKSKQQALENQTQLLNNVLSNIPSSIFWKDDELCYQGCNLNFGKDIGIKELGWIKGKQESDLPWPITNKMELEDFDNKVMDTKKPIINREIEYKPLYTDETQTVLMSRVPLIDREKQKISGVLGVYTDITELKRVEREAKDLTENLENKVTQRTKQLTQANKDLQKTLSELHTTQDKLVASEKMVQLGNLVSGIAKEINEPVLSSRAGGLDLQEDIKNIKEKMDSQTIKRKDFENYLGMTKEKTDAILAHLSRTAKLVRSFKQVAVDQSSETKRKINLGNYLREVISSLSIKIRDANHNIDIDCQDDIDIETYPGALSRCIDILITNSIEHAYPEEDRVEAGNIKLKIFTTETELHIEYQDDGHGIESNKISQIFDPFYTSRKEQGNSGLGLHILYNSITQTLKGRVECKSEVGKGTSFNIITPIEDS